MLRGDREQRESVKGKPTSFRVEFRFERGHRSYKYYESYVDACKADSRECNYGPLGRAIILRARSQQIQVKGPRGGWRRYSEAIMLEREMR